MLQKHAVNPEALNLLERLLSIPELNTFALAGGTGLALQLGHRMSMDLDLFTPIDFVPDLIAGRLRSEFDVELQNASRNTLNLNIDKIKVDLLTFKYPILNPLISVGSLRIYSMEDIGAMKLSALSSRGSKKDFYDLYFILNEYPLADLLNFYREKFETEQEYHIIKSLIYFEDAEDEPEPMLIKKNITWDTLKLELEKIVRDYTHS